MNNFLQNKMLTYVQVLAFDDLQLRTMRQIQRKKSDVHISVSVALMSCTYQVKQYCLWAFTVACCNERNEVEQIQIKLRLGIWLMGDYNICSSI